MTAPRPSGPPMGCDDAGTLLAELALGILPGDQRTAALGHVETCPACQSELAGLVAAGDGLVALVPAGEPPAGFEQRVLAALAAAGPGPGSRPGGPGGWRRLLPRRPRGSSLPRRPSYRVWLTAAAAVALVAAGFGGWALGSGSAPAGHRAPEAAPGPLVEASLTAHGTTVGRVFAYWDNPGWVYMTVDVAGLSGRVTCQLVRSNGTTSDIGWFTVTDGAGYWGAPLPFDPASVRQARLLDDHGNVIASGRL